MGKEIGRRCIITGYLRRLASILILESRDSLPNMKLTVSKIVIVGVSLILAGMTLAADREPILVANLGPQVGEKVPDFELSDQLGQTHNLQSIMGPKGAMILFHRSADW